MKEDVELREAILKGDEDFDCDNVFAKELKNAGLVVESKNCCKHVKKHKKEQVIALKHSMQSGMERHLGDMNKQLRLKLEAEGFNLKAMESLWSLTSAATNSNFTFQPSQTNNPMDCQPEPFLQIGLTISTMLSRTTSLFPPVRTVETWASFFPATCAKAFPSLGIQTAAIAPNDAFTLALTQFVVGGLQRNLKEEGEEELTLIDSFAGEANHGQPSRQEKKTMSSEDCLGWAARDASGHLSPYKFNRRSRDRLPQSDIHAVAAYLR
ncbi:hypothetical protein Ahy_A03g012825 isoform I [Arachis hypogaea]|uniref:Uncharacterized protein n=1 Tax=Arachis hypogaea TaxID=3818 RepID=A0A445DUC3_ARAHY|nr:hypothetical protein Ahy_A03g012825 isoform I [Arachis hypogaea]